MHKHVDNCFGARIYAVSTCLRAIFVKFGFGLYSGATSSATQNIWAVGVGQYDHAVTWCRISDAI